MHFRQDNKGGSQHHFPLYSKIGLYNKASEASLLNKASEASLLNNASEASLLSNPWRSHGHLNSLLLLNGHRGGDPRGYLGRVRDGTYIASDYISRAYLLVQLILNMYEQQQHA